MVKKEKKEFQMSANDVSNLFDEFAKWNIETENSDGGFKFSVQSDNVLYEIQVNVVENFSPEERCFMLNKYPFIKTFADIQNKIFGKIVWNWK